MKIFKLYWDTENFTFVHLTEKNQRWSTYTLEAFVKVGEPLLIANTNSEKKDLPISDFSSLGRNFPFCFSLKAYQILEKVMFRCGIVKEAKHNVIVGTRFIFWPSNVIDCLDEEKSEIFTTATGFKRLIKPVFHMDKIPKESIFIVPQFMASDLFVTEDIAETLKASDLTGYILVDASIPRN